MVGEGIEWHIRRTNRNLLGANLGLLLAVLYLSWATASWDLQTNGYWGITIFGPFLILAGWNLVRWNTRRASPMANPIAKSLSRFTDPKDVIEVVNAELKIPPQESGRIRTTPSWLLHSTLFGLDVWHLAEVVWVYPHVTSYSLRLYWIIKIPLFRRHHLMVCRRDGARFKVGGTEDRVAKWLAMIVTRAPWIVAGFSDEIKNLWDSNPAGFAAAVDERRKNAEPGQ